ncbi:MAG: HAD-IC family P-type ATPase [Alphaproteobacteria bacterium]|nr:HAD-IC family P-type ATPase [Alphaproteobacteria bacterium]
MNDNTAIRQDNWSSARFETVLQRFQSSNEGLSDAEAARRLTQYGRNRLPGARRKSPLLRFLLQFHNVLIYVLIAASVVTAFLGHWVDTGVIVAVVMINAVIGFIQEGKAEEAMDAVRKMLSLHATVIRDGRRQVVDADSLVPGDIVFVQSGDKVPADLRLIRVKSLQIQEAALTGESLPVDKGVEAVAPEALLGDRSSMAYSGTVVTYGQGMGVVVATGSATEIGRISAMLSEVEELTTPLLQRMAEFARWLTVVILVLAAAVFLFGTYVWNFPPSEMFMAAVSLAVSAIPEGLPAIITITLAIGVERMARRSAIIRRLPAVETLGAVTTICSDKTGTLTRNELTARTVVASRSIYEASGSGYDPHGGFTKSGRDVPIDGAPELSEMMRAAALCNDAVLHEKDNVWSVDGDPTEGALLTAAVKGGLDLRAQAQALPRTDVIPFESQHRFMATLHHDHVGNGYIFVKGAPERLLEMCFWQRDGGEEHRPLDGAYWLAKIDEIAAKGQRVLGVAAKQTTADHCELKFGDVETGLTFLGLIGLIDPPREETLDAVHQCAEAGIGVKMITGDHAATAVAIGRELGLKNPDAALTGRDLDALTDDELSKAVLNTNIFARTSPEHKLRLVKALQGHDQIVAMTGDGVNDAPALKRADIGIAMGVKGTEAAKEAAEMVLADDNFASIVHAVHEGRVVYENLKKTILYILPTNGGEAMTVVAAIAMGDVLPVTPVQILWINLVTAVTLGLALAFEPPSAGIMTRPPRAAKEPILSGYFVWRIVFVSFLMLIATFGLYEFEKAEGMGLASARTVAVNALVACEVAYLFNARFLSESSISWRGLFGSRAALIAIGLVVILQALFTYAPWMQHWFGTVALDFATWIHIFAASIGLFFFVEIEKALFRSSATQDFFHRASSKLLTLRSNGRRWAWPLGAALVIFLVLGGGWVYRSIYLGEERYKTHKIARVVSVGGVVAPASVTPIVSLASGVVQAVYCERGTKVAKNQLCAKLDPRPFEDVIESAKGALMTAEAQFAQAKARLAAAQADFDRKTTRSDRRAVSRKALDASKKRLEGARARVAQIESALLARREALASAEMSLRKTDILAPSEGIVVARNVEIGTNISAGAEAPLFLLATDLTKVQVEVEIGEKLAGEIKVGAAAVVTAPTRPGKTFSGVVRSVRRMDTPSENGAIYKVSIDAANPDLLLEPGMTAIASIDVDRRDVSTP